MRLNQPVTQREFELPDGATLMSITDANSIIIYANAAFEQVSGFSCEELQGQPHNIVRHPDMPPAAFADMWSTLKRGEPWTAVVKNRRKNGDHYWVRANATPVTRDGRQVGYMSVRTKATRSEIEDAQRLYRDMHEGRARGRKIHKGVVVRTGLWAWRSLSKTMPVRWRVRMAFLVLLPVLLIAGALVGTSGVALGAYALACASALGLACWMLESQIARPLEQVLAQALGVASGATQNTVTLDRVDEIGMTMRTVGQLGLMFRWLIHDVSAQAVGVRTAASEIAQGNLDLSSHTEQASASVQQTASSMEQMTTAVHNNAGTASQVNELSSSATDAALRGGEVVSQVVATMGEITGSSRRIADIIGVIDGIAFQTNILALNAAVEAARAGEQGRGFAVVAGEVRALAQRSAEAAKEIKQLIASSVERVEAGSKLVDGAGRTMDDIVGQVKRVSDLIGQISSATSEQSDGIAQMAKAVAHLDRITQQNAALVEQGAAASAGLSQQARRLADAVSLFR